MKHFICLIILLLATTTAANITQADQHWEVLIEHESPNRVCNSATALNEPIDIYPQELWRLDGDSDDVPFGYISHIVADEEGTVYMLDHQLTEVDIVNLDGEIWNRVGREGDGPGESRRPRSIFVDNVGNIGICQSYPGKVVLLKPNGEPLDDILFPDYGKSNRLIARSTKYANDRYYLAVSSHHPDENGNVSSHNALVSIGVGESEYLKFDERVFYRDYHSANFKEEDRGRGLAWVWTVGSQGRLYATPSYNSYEIFVYNADGQLAHIIEREYEPLPRPDWHVKELQEYYDNLYADRQLRGVPMSFEASGNDPAIEKFYAREDGSLWVLPSRGAYNLPDGVLGIFDVFDSAGQYDHQAIVHGDGDFFHDSYYISNGLLIVIRNVTIDLSRGENEDDDPDEGKYEIICYRL